MIWQLFSSCFKIGLFTIGGGYAMLPVMESVFVKEKGWLSNEDFLDMVTTVQMIPGSVTVNSSIYIGKKLAGPTGAIAACVGSVLPSFIVILLIASSLSKVAGNPLVDAFFAGARPAVVGLIAVSGLRLGKSIIDSKRALVSTIFLFTLSVFFKIQPAIILALGAVTGIVSGMW